MIPSFLITFREVIEASLIVATILGILVKLRHIKSIRVVWLATLAAFAASLGFLLFGSLVGIKVQELYTGRTEELIEGILMVTSAVFITWAVFFLHTYFGKYKVRLLQKVKHTVEQENPKGLFALVFTAVFREGFEIVLFLTTIYFSSQPAPILGGFGLGLIAGLLVSFAFFSATLKMPVYWAFRTSSLLLILFAAGLLARGAHEFAQAGMLPEMGKVTLAFLPDKTTFVGDITKAVFGVTRYMDLIQLSLYLTYIWIMHWWVFVRSRYSNQAPEAPSRGSLSVRENRY